MVREEREEKEREALAMMEKTLFCILFPPFAEGLCQLVRPASITAQSLSLSILIISMPTHPNSRQTS